MFKLACAVDVDAASHYRLVAQRLEFICCKQLPKPKSVKTGLDLPRRDLSLILAAVPLPNGLKATVKSIFRVPTVQ